MIGFCVSTESSGRFQSTEKIAAAKKLSLLPHRMPYADVIKLVLSFAWWPHGTSIIAMWVLINDCHIYLTKHTAHHTGRALVQAS
jgi:hypothetical protein